MNAPGTPLEDLKAAVEAAAGDLRNGELPLSTAPTLERPRKAGFGDYSTNAAMLLAPVLGAPPREIAERLGEALRARMGERVDRVEVAGPGFLNVFLSDAWYTAAVAHVLAAGDGYGGGLAATRERVLVEFVSANPTGPVHVGHARNAAYGDALARLLAFEGHDVAREYYVNDYGTQAVLFGASIQARARGEEPPEGGYQGDYIAELAAEIPDAATADPEAVARRGIELMLERIAASLERFRVEIGTWFSERSLHERGLVEHAFEQLEKMGTSYRSEGALWLRTTSFGEDKDRVLERSSGDHTYFASDIAYHQEKRERGFDRQIDVWGADHHGYVRRLKAAFEALGGEPDRLELLIMQFVHLVERGGRASMSKRAGEFVTLDDLVEEIGVDAARWFLLARSHDTTIELDLDLAREQSAENPVYYVQYAHARIASMLRKAGAERVEGALAFDPGGLALEPAEHELIKKLLAFPAETSEAAARRAPHRVATYALELAQAFTAFYRDCRVVGAETRGAGVLPHRAQRRRAAHDRPFARPARRRRAGDDVMPALYDCAASGNCYKVRLLLAQLEIPHESVEIDIFRGESRTPEHVARNPAGRTPVWETDDGRFVPESGAILLLLAEGTALLPSDPVQRARVTGWLFFEQNLLEPNLGTGRFWKLTGRAGDQPGAYARFQDAGAAALDVLERRTAESPFLAGDDYTVADIANYGYAHVAGDVEIDMDAYPSVRGWLERVEATPRFMNDLAPYPPHASGRPM